MKNMFKVIYGFALAAMLAGCMSMDEMLASDDPFWHDIGESQAMRFAIDQYGTADLQAKLDAVGKMRDQEKLAKVYVAKSTVPEVKRAVRSKITEEKAFASMLVTSDDPTIHKEALENIRSDEMLLTTAGAIIGDVSKKSLADKLVVLVKGETAIADHLGRIVRDELALKKKLETTDYLTTSMRNDDVKKFLDGYEFYKALASHAKPSRAVRALAADNVIRATKGTQYDFATPLEESLDKARREAEMLAAEREREKSELLSRDPAAFAKKYPDEWKTRQEDLAAEKAAAEKAAAEAQKRMLEDCSDGAAYAIYCGKADKLTLAKIAKEHKQKICRFIAAYKCGGDVLRNFIATEKPDDVGKNLSVGGLYLGMNFADAYIAFVKNFPDLKFRIESSKEELAGVADYNEMNIVMITDAKDGSGPRVVRAPAGEVGMPVKNIQLVPDMVVSLFGEKGDIEETGESVFSKLGLTAKHDTVWSKVKGLTTATQNVLKYKSMSGGRIYFALENADVDNGVITDLSEGDPGFEFACYWMIGKEMGDAGTLILDGKKLTGGKPLKANDEASNGKGNPKSGSKIDGLFGYCFGQEMTSAPIYKDALGNNIYDGGAEVTQKIPDVETQISSTVYVQVRAKGDSNKAWQIMASYPVSDNRDAMQLKGDIVRGYEKLLGVKTVAGGIFVLGNEKVMVDIGNVRLCDEIIDEVHKCVTITLMAGK